jgi:hypothetical protein
MGGLGFGGSVLHSLVDDKASSFRRKVVGTNPILVRGMPPMSNLDGADAMLSGQGNDIFGTMLLISFDFEKSQKKNIGPHQTARDRSKPRANPEKKR